MRLPRLTLQSKAFIALAAMLVVLVLLFSGFSRWSLQRGLGSYVASIELARMDWLVERLQRHYQEAGGWDTLRSRPGLWRQLRQRGPGGGDGPPGMPGDFREPPDRPPPPPDGGPGGPSPAYGGRLGLLDADGRPVAGSPPHTAPRGRC